jgi:predicted metalloprotease with PDZ domain
MASTHLQGELLGDCLDMLIRDATDGRRSLDDVMKLIYKRFGQHQPLHDSDVESAVTKVCQCGAAHAFFQSYLYDGHPMDFSSSLHLLGLRIQHGQMPASDKQGQPLPDKRVYAWVLRDDTSLRILVTNPNSCWALGGLHTGDIITSLNGVPMRTRQDFQSAIAAIHIGDTLSIETKKGSVLTPHSIIICGYSIPLINISIEPTTTPRQRHMLQNWLFATRI